MMQVNWLAILAAGIINMVIGSLWYSPVMFANPWMQSLGWTREKIEQLKKKQKGMGMQYGIMFIGALFMGYVMSMLTKATNTTTLDMGAGLGFWVWLGMIVPVVLPGVLFEQKPWKWYVINVGYYLVVLVIIGALMAVWR